LGEFWSTNWAIVYFGDLFENYRSGPHFGQLFFNGFAFSLTKNDLVNILGAVFTNSSGHHVPERWCIEHSFVISLILMAHV
jgi:hypothetical protein